MEENDQPSRSDLRMIEQAVRHKWDIPEDMMSFLPRRMLRIAAKSTSERNVIAATRVLAMLVKHNKPPEASLHLHQHGRAAEIQAQPEGMTLEQRRADNAGRLDRIKRLGRIG
jgi:hypothetical protein